MPGAGEWAGRDLGTRTACWDERDAILYALAVGAGPEQLDLVFEKRLRVLPTFGLTLAQWAPDQLGSSGAFEVGRAVHGSQTLEVLAPLPRSGEAVVHARVRNVWDKGSAAVFEVEVECAYFVAVWSIFAPGAGGFGGERGPGRSLSPEASPRWSARRRTAENQAALYRLLGDRHHIHIDPGAALRIGQARPILHGLATLATASLAVAEAVGAHPADLSRIEGRFSSVVLPGDELRVDGWDGGVFVVESSAGPVIDGGLATYR